MALEIRKLKLQPAYQVVSAELERQIVAGKLKPGDPLPSECDLAEKFGVNRSTVREGIRQLESEGLVRREGGKRLFVRTPGVAELAPRATRALIMQQITFQELWEVVGMCESTAARLAATNATDEEIADLMAILKRMEDGVAAGQSVNSLDRDFHNLVARSAKNRALMLAREPLALLLYPAFDVIHPRLPQADKRQLVAHRHMVEALQRRDPEQAALWARKHIDDLRRGWTLVGLTGQELISQP
jgi:DNA-binding FadR family transcriptional regulator